VDCEHRHHYLRKAKIAFFNFEPTGLGPISLLELGLCARQFGFDFYSDFETAYQRLYDLVRDRYA